jgi:non-ribosomal peptide synthetase component E (peptide arylation enzyme)
MIAKLTLSSIPTQDILSYYFDSPQFDQDKPLIIDALDTKRFWTAKQAKDAIRKLAAGFKAAGLRPGDCVCIHSFNDLNYPILVNGIAGFGGVYTFKSCISVRIYIELSPCIGRSLPC